ncbi:hypothetical protein COOONC_00945 [Cooperia oncophora]
MFATWVAVKITVKMGSHKAIVGPEEMKQTRRQHQFICCDRIMCPSMLKIAHRRMSTVSCVTRLTSCAMKTINQRALIQQAPIRVEGPKVTEFFKRPTKLTIYQTKRCANAGSCIENKCDRLK